MLSEELYLCRYYKLINHYKTVMVNGHYEKHHIIPKCMGGTDDIENLILLPTRVHFIAHYLLHKSYPNNKKLSHAFAMMGVCNKFQNRKVNSYLYEQSKIARSSALLGVPRTELTKSKMRKPKSNKDNYKKPKSFAHSQKISESLKGIKKETTICPVCNKVGSISNMKRWHFDNCKSVL
jgi:hypothetical protein